MKRKSIFGMGCALLFMSLSASAGTVTLDVLSYTFPLAGGGGGASATLNGTPVEIFCDDFANEIGLPSSNSAYVTTLGLGADLSETRFGAVSNAGGTAISGLGSQDDAFFNTGNGSHVLARYEMVAYLVSLYNQAAGNTTADNQIQEAIWTIMDPKAEGSVINPANVSASNYLEQAASWSTSMNANKSPLNTSPSRLKIE